jgi:atypical dual specificity phosphatase
MNIFNIPPIFKHDTERYAIVFVNGFEPTYLNKFKYFNLNAPTMLKKRIERKPDILADFFVFSPEKILFDGTPIDYKLIMFCKSHIDECSTYCKIMQKHFEQYIHKFYTDVDIMLNDYPEAKYTQEELYEINQQLNKSVMIHSNSPSPMNMSDTNPSKIYDNLYLGEVFHSSDEKFIKEKNIKHILTLLEYPCELSVHPDYQYIKFKHINIGDKLSTNISDYFTECIEFIKQAHEKGDTVYVHCAMGISRSVSIVIAYIMEEKNMKFEEAFSYVKTCRPQAEPNMAFTCQLMQFEKQLKLN